MKVSYISYPLKFKTPSGTSRGVLIEKTSWFLYIKQREKLFIGECGLLESLSYDNVEYYENMLRWVCDNFFHLTELEIYLHLSSFPSIQFGVEQLKSSLKSECPMILYPSDFTNGKGSITINGLVWMGDMETMEQQIEEKISQNFNCIKLKIGSLDFKSEYNLIKKIRSRFDKYQLQIRVDANGAFTVKEALDYLEQLSVLDIHSIEQPIKQGQWQEMAKLRQSSKIPIALDEELIGIISLEEKKRLLDTIEPQYIILKPSLIGGVRGSKQWTTLAKKRNIGWWITSALESNVGLSAIAQWAYTLGSTIPQGLGTGGLFSNNFLSPLVLKSDKLKYDKSLSWQIDL